MRKRKLAYWFLTGCLLAATSIGCAVPRRGASQIADTQPSLFTPKPAPKYVSNEISQTAWSPQRPASVGMPPEGRYDSSAEEAHLPINFLKPGGRCFS